MASSTGDATGTNYTLGNKLLDTGKMITAGLTSGTASIPLGLESGVRNIPRQALEQQQVEPRKIGALTFAEEIAKKGAPQLFANLGRSILKSATGQTVEEQQKRQKEDEVVLDRAISKLPRIPGFSELAESGKRGSQYLTESLSEEGKLALENSQIQGNILKSIQEGTIDNLSFGKDPSFMGYALQGSQVLGSIVPVIATALMTRNTRFETSAPTAVGFGQGAGEAVEKAKEHVKNMSDEQLAIASPYFKHMIENGVNPKEARQVVSDKAAEYAAQLQGAVSAFGGNITAKLVTGKFDKLLTTTVKNKLSQIALGGAAGMTEEGLQEFLEGVASDLAIDKTVVKEIGAESFANFIMGSIGGVVPGAYRGAVAKREEAVSAQPEVAPTVTPVTPEAPPSAAPVAAAPQAPVSGAISETELETAEEPTAPVAAKPSEAMVAIVDEDGNVTDEVDKVDLNNLYEEDGKIYVRGEFYDHDLMSVLADLKDEDQKMELVKRAEELQPKAEEVVKATAESSEAQKNLDEFLSQDRDEAIKKIADGNNVDLKLAEKAYEAEKEFREAKAKYYTPQLINSPEFKAAQKKHTVFFNKLRQASKKAKAAPVVAEPEEERLLTRDEIDAKYAGASKQVDRIKELSNIGDEDRTDEEDDFLDAAHRELNRTAERISGPPRKKGYVSSGNIDVNQFGDKWVAGSSYMGTTGGYGLGVSYDSDQFNSREEAINAEIDKMRPYAQSQKDAVTLKWLDSIDSRIEAEAPKKAQTKEEKAEANRKRQEEKKAKAAEEKAAAKKAEEESWAAESKIRQEREAAQRQKTAEEAERRKEIESLKLTQFEDDTGIPPRDLKEVNAVVDETEEEYGDAARNYIKTGEGKDLVEKARAKHDKAIQEFNKTVREIRGEEQVEEVEEEVDETDSYNLDKDAKAEKIEGLDGRVKIFLREITDKDPKDFYGKSLTGKWLATTIYKTPGGASYGPGATPKSTPITYNSREEALKNSIESIKSTEQSEAKRTKKPNDTEAIEFLDALQPKTEEKPAADFDSYVDSVSDQIDQLVDYARIDLRTGITRAEVISKLKATYKESPEKAQGALDNTKANMLKAAKERLLNDLKADFREATGKPLSKEADLVRAIKSGVLDISEQENADDVYKLFDIKKSDIKKAATGAGVPALIDKFSGSFFGKPKEVSEEVYDEAAKQFLEGDLKAKVPTGKMDTINFVRLKDVAPKPIEKTIKPFGNTFADNVKALLQVASKEDIRYYLKGVNVEPAKKRLVATDGHRMAAINNISLKDVPALPEGQTVYGKDNKYIAGPYPDVDRVLPKEHAKNKLTVDVKGLGDYSRGANKAWRYISSKMAAPVQLSIGETVLSFNAKYIEDMSNIFRQMGYDKAEISMADGRLYATSPDGKVQQVIMSMRDENPLFAKYPLDGGKAKPKAERAKTMTEEEVFGEQEEIPVEPRMTQQEINKARQKAKKDAAVSKDKGTFYENFTGEMSEADKEAMIQEVRDEKILELAGITRRITTVVKKIAGVGGDIETQKRLNYLLSKQADLANEIKATKPERRSADWFRARAAEELAEGNLMPETMAVIDELYKKYPSFLEGLKLSVRAGKVAGVEGSFEPIERLVSIFKNPFSVTQDETMRHEIMHSLEQMMTPEAQIALVNAWADAVAKAMKKHTDEKSQEFFNAVLNYVEDPTKANFRKATARLPELSFYQYMNPSEFWAVNGERLMKSQLGTPWARFVKGVQKILEALKNVFGFNNRYAVHREFDRLMKGESGQMTDTMLADYLKKTDEKFVFLNQVEDVDELLDRHERPDTPLHPSDSVKDRLLDKVEDLKGYRDRVRTNPKIEASNMVGSVDRAVTYARNKNVWFGTGLELADLKKYMGQLRDSNGFAIASIALTNALHAGHVATQVITQGALRFDPIMQQFTAYVSKYSLANVVREKAKLVKQLGEQRASNLINSFFEAKRSRSIQNEFYNRQAEYETLKQKFEAAVETEEKDQLYKDMVESREALEKVSVAMDKVNMTDEAIDDFIAMEKKFPELRAMMKNWTAVNQNMIDNMEFSGIISQKRAAQLREIEDYVPWYRIQDEMADPHDPVSSGVRGLTNVGKEKKFKKGTTDKDIDDIVDNMIHNVMMTTRNSIRNYAANRIAMEYATRNDKGKIKVFPKEGVMADGAVRVNILANGRRIVIEIKDPLIAESVLGMESIEIPMYNVLGMMANGLRRGITTFPIFQVKQLFMDAPTAAWVSGVKNPFAVWGKTFGSFVAALNPNDPIVNLMKSYGIGGYQSSARTPEKELKLQIGLIGRSPFARMMKILDHIGDASDYAQRRSIYKQVLKETGDEMQALIQANNVIDFLKHGSAKHAQFLTRTVSFMNAYAQSVDVLAQSMAGGGLKGKQRSQVFAQFVKTGAILAGLSLLYAFAVGDDEEYQKMDDQTKARNFIIPKSLTKLVGMENSVKIPMHTSASFFFKSVPELTYNWIMTEGTKNEVDNQRVRTALRKAAVDALLGPNVTPTGVKPFVEIALNRNFFTGGTLTPKGMENLESFRQYTANTSELGKVISKGMLGVLNPIEADHLMKSLLGTVGASVMWGSNLFSGDRVEPNASANPLYGAFVSAPVPRGPEDIYYDLKERSTKVYNTYIDLMKKGRTEEGRKYRSENEALFKAYGYTNGVEQGLKQVNAEIRRVGDLPGDKLTGAEKRERITFYQNKKNEILKDVVEYRKRAGL
jgi:hypothetical protein